MGGPAIAYFATLPPMQPNGISTCRYANHVLIYSDFALNVGSSHLSPKTKLFEFYYCESKLVPFVSNSHGLLYELEGGGVLGERFKRISLLSASSTK